MRAHLPTTVVNCARGMAQLESNCALYSNIEKRIRRNAYPPAVFAIRVYLNMQYVYQARYVINVEENQDIFAQIDVFMCVRNQYTCEGATKAFLDNRLDVCTYTAMFSIIFINITTFFIGPTDFLHQFSLFYHSCHFFCLVKRHILSIIAQRRSLNDTWII